MDVFGKYKKTIYGIYSYFQYGIIKAPIENMYVFQTTKHSPNLPLLCQKLENGAGNGYFPHQISGMRERFPRPLLNMAISPKNLNSIESMPVGTCGGLFLYWSSYINRVRGQSLTLYAKSGISATDCAFSL